MDPAIAAIIGGAVGAGVTGIFGLLAILHQRRSEERRQIRELAVKVAIDNWKHYTEFAKTHGGMLRPVELYIVHAAYLVSQLDGSLRTPEEIGEHLRKTYAATESAGKVIEDYNKELRSKTTHGTSGHGVNRGETPANTME